jgi:hypothetical protein
MYRTKELQCWLQALDGGGPLQIRGTTVHVTLLNFVGDC